MCLDSTTPGHFTIWISLSLRPKTSQKVKSFSVRTQQII